MPATTYVPAASPAGRALEAEWAAHVRSMAPQSPHGFTAWAVDLAMLVGLWWVAALALAAPRAGRDDCEGLVGEYLDGLGDVIWAAHCWLYAPRRRGRP